MSDNTTRPGGWVNGIGWVALLSALPSGTSIRFALGDDGPDAGVGITTGLATFDHTPVIVTRWADGTTPTEPAANGLEPGEIVAPRFYAMREQRSGEVMPRFYVVDSAGMGRIFLGRGVTAEVLAKQIGLRPIIEEGLSC